MATVHYERVSVEELYERLDSLAREQLGLSADEFLQRARQQGLNMASPETSRLAVLARIIDQARAA
jgi:hypothetical protein